MRAIEARANLTDEVHKSLRDAIVTTELAPCAPLAQEALAARLNVSRQPVVQALRLLELEGLAVRRGRRGVMVAPIEAARIYDFYQVRASLDGLAARLAAARVASDSLPGAARSALEAAIQAGKKNLASASIKHLVSLDERFHRAIHTASGNPAITEMVEPVWPHFLRSMALVLRLEDYRSKAWSEHTAIAQAIFAGDQAAAEVRARAHAEAAGESISERLKQQQQTSETDAA